MTEAEQKQNPLGRACAAIHGRSRSPERRMAARRMPSQIAPRCANRRMALGKVKRLSRHLGDLGIQRARL